MSLESGHLGVVKLSLGLYRSVSIDYIIEDIPLCLMSYKINKLFLDVFKLST